ncbi:relaxase/mobilization nuclease domain-containing protein [[Eubacterium] hominis]|uniref:relaxase/mobilization nuclease domain-containing protein n=1 Tax=[Eubacterium] hominis TaxID=2764325 RepID=UPI003A4DD3DC
MATTSIWDVNDNLKRVLDYISNPEKTNTVSESDYHYNGLNQVISYTTQDLKTEKQLYVSGINCSMATALQDMMITKKAYHKTDGILAYHAYQSFAPGEVDAETAHKIGIELAQAMWGDRFEVLVSTHLDKAHYHNHFVINSVSFKDGLKYYDNKENYKKIRKLSDDLCRKYQLSVIENPKKKSMHYAEWQAEKQHRPTWRSAIREDVDYAINKSMTMKQFFQNLEAQGYEIKYGKHIAVRPPTKERFVRLRSLSNDEYYTEENIKELILTNSIIKWESVQKTEPKKYYYKGDITKARKLTGFRALYFHYMYCMGILPKNALNKKRVHYLLKEDLRYMDQITQETTLLCKNKIDTLDELEQKVSKVTTCLDGLVKERRCVYNKIRRCCNPDSKEKLQQDVAYLSAQIKSLRKEVVLYEGVKNRSIVMKDKLHKVKESNETKESKKVELSLNEK